MTSWCWVKQGAQWALLTELEKLLRVGSWAAINLVVVDFRMLFDGLRQAMACLGERIYCGVITVVSALRGWIVR